MAKRAEYYCVAVRRNYEEIWRVVSQHKTREEAQALLDEKRAYVGVFNYNNAELRIVSRSEAKVEFGKSWEYVAIGARPTAKSTASAKAKS